MYVIYPDTNALWGEPYWRTDRLANLKEVAHEYADVEVWLSPVVLAELERHRTAEVDDAERLMRRGFAKLGAHLAEDLGAEPFATVVQSTKDKSEQRSQDAVTGAWIRQLGWPKVSAESLAAKALHGRRPFSHFNPQASRPESKGFRDAVIWEGLLAEMAEHDEHKYIFVTRDSAAFVTKTGDLAPELVAELHTRGLAAGRLTVVPNVFTAIKHLQPLLGSAKPRDFAAMSLIARWADEDSQDDLVGHRDMAHEISTSLDLDLEVPFGWEEITSWYFSVESASTWPDAPNPTWTVLGEITFTAAVFKGDYLTATDEQTDTVSLVDDLNRHYFEIEVVRPVEVTLAIDTSSSAVQPVTAIAAKVLH